MKPDEKFFAWLDGELSGNEASAIEAQVASDVELTALADKHRAMQSRLSSAFDAVATAPVPTRLENASSSSGKNVVDLPLWKRGRVGRHLPAAPQWAMMAATLAAGIFVGSLVPGRISSPVQVENGAVYAAASLDHALNNQLASAPSKGSIRIGLTFRNSAGEICRTFTGEAADGLACRRNERWQIRGIFPGEGESGDYRMAGGMNSQLASLLDSSMNGEAFDADHEQAAKERGWR